MDKIWTAAATLEIVSREEEPEDEFRDRIEEILDSMPEDIKVKIMDSTIW